MLYPLSYKRRLLCCTRQQLIIIAERAAWRNWEFDSGNLSMGARKAQRIWVWAVENLQKMPEIAFRYHSVIKMGHFTANSKVE
jgi:hypothetical protein